MQVVLVFDHGKVLGIKLVVSVANAEVHITVVWVWASLLNLEIRVSRNAMYIYILACFPATAYAHLFLVVCAGQVFCLLSSCLSKWLMFCVVWKRSKSVRSVTKWHMANRVVKLSPFKCATAVGCAIVVLHCTSSMYSRFPVLHFHQHASKRAQTHHH